MMDAVEAKRKSPVKGVLFEGLLVSLVGVLVALAANAISPRGLNLARNYFPRSVASASPVSPNQSTAPAPAPPNPVGDSIQNSAARRLAGEGLQTVDSDTAARLVQDPRFLQQLIIFIDARDDEHFLAGHIPGAFEFDRYHPEKYLMDVLTVCQTAEQVVVYCNGGDCEDSEFAALALRDAGVANQKLFVYLGGIKEWDARGQPIEIGPRQSGKLRGAAQ